MTFLLLDECVAKCCAQGGASYTAQRTIQVEGLGRRADDKDIYLFVRQSECILVTLNGRDFAALAVHHGPIRTIVLPNVRPTTQRAYLRWVLPAAYRTFARDPHRFVEVNAYGKAISYLVQRGFAWDHRPRPEMEDRRTTVH